MELRHLISFRTVANTLSFTRAANQLGYVQSAVTAHVKALERELGVDLFDRSRRRTVLTDAGVELLGYAERIIDLVREATIVIGEADEPRGSVTVSAPEVLCTYRLPAVIRRLHERHPAVQLVFRPTSTGALDAELTRALAQGEIEVAFVLEESIEPTPALRATHLVDEPLRVIAARDHPLARAVSLRPSDLDGVPVILTDKGCGYRRVFERALRLAGVQPTIAGEFTSGETVKRCVQSGVAIGVVAAISVEEELADGRLAELPWAGPPLCLSTYLVSSKTRWISPAVAALHEVTDQTFARYDIAAPSALAQRQA